MSYTESDPRIFFASERTLLAWLRTGITIMALGFVVSRFGLFLQLLASQSRGASTESYTYWSAALGVAFIAVGAFAIFFAAIQHRRFIATLPLINLPKDYSIVFAVALTILISVLGLALAGFLFITEM